MSEFVLHQEEGIVEAVARTSGPAGVVTASLFDGSIEIDLDGADVRNICGVRAYSDNDLRDEQYEWLSRLISVSRRELEAGLSGPSLRRVGSARSRNFSAREFDADLDTSFSVFALDWCSRNPNSPKGTLVELLGVVSARRAGLWTPQERVFSFEEIRPILLSYQMAGMAGRGRFLLTQALSDAVQYGLLDGTNDVELHSLLSIDTASSVLDSPMPDALELFDLSRSSLSLSSELVSMSRINDEVFLPRAVSAAGVSIWEGSAFADRVITRWLDSSNLGVSITGAISEDEQWWARCFDQNSHLLLGAAPIKTESGTSIILIKEGPITLDIARSVSAPLLSKRGSDTQDAINAGRRAGVSERLGDTDRAEEYWRECATKHEQAGDPHRAKMAGARTMMRQELSEPLLGDYFL
jgi:hypothetical protein